MCFRPEHARSHARAHSALWRTNFQTGGATVTTGQAKINGATIEVRSGETILAAARRAGVEIPTLCYAEHLLPEGGCRLCLVNTNRSRRPVAACTTLIQPGMEIRTHTPEIEALRREVLSFYLGARPGGGRVDLAAAETADDRGRTARRASAAMGARASSLGFCRSMACPFPKEHSASKRRSTPATLMCASIPSSASTAADA